MRASLGTRRLKLKQTSSLPPRTSFPVVGRIRLSVGRDGTENGNVRRAFVFFREEGENKRAGNWINVTTFWIKMEACSSWTSKRGGSFKRARFGIYVRSSTLRLFAFLRKFCRVGITEIKIRIILFCVDKQEYLRETRYIRKKIEPFKIISLWFLMSIIWSSSW